MSETRRPLTPERWRTLRPALDEAMSLDGAERRAFVEAAFPGDATLNRELSALADADAADGGLLDAGGLAQDLLSEVVETDSTAPLPAAGALRRAQLDGTVLGPYRLVREIGSGGMGAVYLAERSDGTFRKEVALKILRPGVDGLKSQGRFRQERQILAGLEHPGIARLLDGGAAPDGRPFLVMELVAGLPCDSYCDERGLGVEERLRLFLQMTDAVEFAHRKLVVHRDLKPSNILVTPEGQVKLLDFGIAKLLEGEEDGGFTVPGRPLLTLTHASPEQVRGEPISTASDVYSLGVLLYELLAGRSPYPPVAGSRVALQLAVLQCLPSPPSAHAAVSRDLDAIVLKALRKQPEERYLSVEAMAEDVRRFLEGRPVAARGGGLPYRVLRFAGRNAVAVGAAALLLGLASGAAVLHERRLERERRVAQAEAEKAFVLTDFAFEMIEGSPLARPGGPPAWLPAAERQARAHLRVSPEVGAAMLRDVARLHMARKELDDAARLLTEVLAVQREIPELGELETAETLRTLGKLATLQRNPGEAARLYQKSLALFRRGSRQEGGRAVHTMIDLGNAFLGLQQLDSAADAYRHAIQLVGANDADPQWGRARNNLGIVALRRKDWAGAARLIGEALPNVERCHDADSPELGEVLLTYAEVLERLGDRDRALPHARRGLEIYERALTAEDSRLAQARALLARIAGSP